MKNDLLANRHIGISKSETVVYPGHGAPTTIGTEKAENPFFR